MIMHFMLWKQIKWQSKPDTVLDIQANSLPRLILIHKSDKGTFLIYVTYRASVFRADSSVFDREIPLNFRADYEEEAVLHSTNDPVEVTVHGLYLFITFSM